jgi:hypothetical protein
VLVLSWNTAGRVKHIDEQAELPLALAAAKARTHEAVFAHLAVSAPGRLRLLCGDLNTPRKEHPDGTIWTFARDRHGRPRPERGELGRRATPRWSLSFIPMRDELCSVFHLRSVGNDALGGRLNTTSEGEKSDD